ncbi:imidazolonepropionase [Microbulbifer hydrolyticus]|uniref:Imidazolonepropionase n=1 Tax=Microbulbifer hydrolyticus TaxID=48074 RepID=A0A6P1T8C3_9GAMM|nr:imidazolonepropionase [Microbulbifer hydrolyticus]MBB5211306.1 imidazolonepropionase [Microbulbifer hydrolyticus]QHQ37933.1 imidazolonepropionase [Microbulbifer hydrolyticus]
MTERCDLLITNVHAATMDPSLPGAYGAVEDAAVAVTGNKIVWIGPRQELPECTADQVVDGEGQWLTPGLIDCHTHLVYGGHRAGEFARRLGGESYEEVARAGGGILSTVRSTRAASAEDLYRKAEPRLKALMSEGVTTVEIKSGYGLELDTELKQLRVARRLAQHYPVNIITTCLAAHALPPEYDGRADEYIDLVCNEILPAVAREQLADAVDMFCETIAFSVEQCRKVIAAAQKLDLPVKVHAEQLASTGATRMAANAGALSVEHIEYITDEDIAAMAENGTAAVLLPGAFYTLKETRVPPVEKLRAAGVPIALSTDLNPGSCPIASLRLMMNMGCNLFGLTPAEALAGVTRSAARALGVCCSRGVLHAGLRADMALWPMETPDQLAYEVGALKPADIFVGGLHVTAG